MKKLSEKGQAVLGIIIVLIAFLAYSYFNYYKRAEAIENVNRLKGFNRLTQIWHFRELHVNVFDYIIADRSQYQFIFVKPRAIRKVDSQNYYVEVVQWKQPKDIETLSQIVIERNNDILISTETIFIWGKENSGESVLLEKTEEPVSWTSEEIKGTIFEYVDNWIRDEYKDDGREKVEKGIPLALDSMF